MVLYLHLYALMESCLIKQRLIFHTFQSLLERGTVNIFKKVRPMGVLKHHAMKVY